MNICPNCGLATSGMSGYCSNCGTAIRTDSNPAQTAAATVVVQPMAHPTGQAAGAGQAIDQKIENHLVKAIIATVCCCIPFGIVAIVYASKVSALIAQNDRAAALEASAKATIWGNLSIGVGALVTFTYTIIYYKIIAAAASLAG